MKRYIIPSTLFVFAAITGRVNTITQLPDSISPSAFLTDSIDTNLGEVVVVGYASQKKVNVTGSVSSIGASTLLDRPITNVTTALAGLASGLTVTNSGGNTPGFESQSIRVRGLGTLNDAAPLVVVDGMTGIALSDINPGDIENISILKDASSASIYGSRAANGVILVTTRHGGERAPKVTYSGNISFETVAKRLNLVTNYADFMEIQNAALINGETMPDKTLQFIPIQIGRTIFTETPLWCRIIISQLMEARKVCFITSLWDISIIRE